MGFNSGFKGLILIADKNDFQIDKVFLCVWCCYISRNFKRIKIVCSLGNYVRVSILVMMTKNVLMRKMICGGTAFIWAAYLDIVLRLRISGAILQLPHMLQYLARGYTNIFSYDHIRAYAFFWVGKFYAKLSAQAWHKKCLFQCSSEATIQILFLQKIKFG